MGVFIMVVLLVTFFVGMGVYFAFYIRWGIKDWKLQKEQKEKYGYKENTIMKSKKIDKLNIDKVESYNPKSSEIQRKEKE